MERYELTIRRCRIVKFYQLYFLIYAILKLNYLHKRIIEILSEYIKNRKDDLIHEVIL